MQREVREIAETPFPMFEATTAFDGSEVGMVRSTHQASNELARVFFSKSNVDTVQRRLRDVIRERMGYVIDRQSDEHLLIIMRYVYMQSGRNTGGTAEIRRLNELVLKEIVPQVASGIEQYLAYLRDASTLPQPIARGAATSIKGRNTVELYRGV